MSFEARCLSQGPARADGMRYHCRLPLGHRGDCVHGEQAPPEGLTDDEAILFSSEPVTTVQVAINCLLLTIAQQRAVLRESHAVICLASTEAFRACTREDQRDRSRLIECVRSIAALFPDGAFPPPFPASDTVPRPTHSCERCGAPYYDDGEPAFDDHPGAR